MVAPSPTAYSVSFSYSGYEAANPGTPKPGLNLDADFATVAASTASIIAALADIRRADGALVNYIVTPSSFSTAALALMAGGSWTPKGNWTTGTAYAVGNVVAGPTGGSYVCATAHTAGTFSTDLTAGKWVVLSAISAGQIPAIPASVSGDSGKILQATGANTYAWVSYSINSIGTGTAGAPGLPLAEDSATGLYRPFANTIGIAVSGTAAAVFSPGGMVLGGSAIGLSTDGAGYSYLSGAAALSVPGGISYNTDDNKAVHFHVNSYGQVDLTRLQTKQLRLDLDTASINFIDRTTGGAAAITPSLGSLALAGTATAGPRISLAFPYGGSTFSWTLNADPGTRTLGLAPSSSGVIFQVGATWTNFLTVAGTPFGRTGGVNTQDAYVQGTLSGGTAGTETYSVTNAGAATFASVAATTMTLNGTTLHNYSAAAPTGTVTEFGPNTFDATSPGSTSATTTDVSAGYVLVGIRTVVRSSRYLDIFVRAKTLALS